MRYLIYLLGSITLLAAGAPSTSLANIQQHSANVYVWEYPQTLGTDYYYRAVNGSETAVITGVTVGYDYFHGIPELLVEPEQIISPPGWSGELQFTEESREFEVRWVSTDPNYDIPPGGSMSGFGVKLAQQDSRYRTSHFTVIFGDSTAASDRIESDVEPIPVDTTPPSLSVVLSPSEIWPPNKKMVEVNASITVQDDNDSSPSVRLISITCSDCEDPTKDIEGAVYDTDDRTFFVRADRIGQRKEGRVYEVTYSATDASGNTAITTATVVVPHDQRR